jgi:flagellar motor switch/type III secretory pathway protein FliN
MSGERITGGTTDEWTLSGLRGRTRDVPEAAAPTPPEPEPEIDPDRPFPTKRGILSKAEIEALLRPDLSDMEPEAASVGDADPFAGESLDLVLFDAEETHAGISASELQVLATRMMAALRRDGLLSVALELGSIGPLPSEWPAGTVHLVFETSRGDPVASMALPPAFVEEILETLCGQEPLPQADHKAAAPGVLGSRLLREAFAPLAPPVAALAGQGLALRRVETDARFARLVEGFEGRISFTLLAGGTGPAHRISVMICPVDPSPEDGAGALIGAIDESGLPEHLESRLHARLATLKLPVSQLTDLVPGRTLLLGVPPDQPVELVTRLGGEARPVAEARIGRLGGQMAVKLSRIG